MRNVNESSVGAEVNWKVLLSSRKFLSVFIGGEGSSCCVREIHVQKNLINKQLREGAIHLPDG